MVTLIPIGAIGGGGSSGPVTSDDITDATTVGKALVKAVDAADARSKIGAGTGSSNLAIGSTGSTAMAGNKTAADLGGVLTTRTIAGLDLSTDRTQGEVTDALRAASTTAKGTVELATTAETRAGTDATLALTAAGMSALLVELVKMWGWPLIYNATSGWPARTTMPSWAPFACYCANDPDLAAASVPYPTDRVKPDALLFNTGVMVS